MNLGPYELGIIHQGDAVGCLRRLPDACVHMAVTSPPYWGLRDYGEKGQRGLEATPEEHVARMVAWGREMRRVLRPDGTLWLNYGDCHANDTKWGGARGGKNYTSAAGGYQGQRQRRCTGLKAKDLVGMPWRVAFALQGFAVISGGRLNDAADLLAEARMEPDPEVAKWRIAIVEDMLRAWADLSLWAEPYWNRCDVVWFKSNPMPESCQDRPTRAHEFVFMLTMSGSPTFWTHRDLPGTRTRPKPDYRWRRFDGVEMERGPDEANWRKLCVPCPECGGSKRMLMTHLEECLGEPYEVGSEYVPCERCKRADKQGVVRPTGKVQKWWRVNLWRGHDYYYDAEAVKERCESGPSDVRKMIEGRGRIGGKHKTLVDPLSKASGATNIGRKRAVGHPSGRNLRSVWPMATQPYPGTHYATFPERLPEICIKAGTSQRGVCPECGAPWARVVEMSAPVFTRAIPAAPKYAPGLAGEHRTKAGLVGSPRRTATTIGCRPTCGCGCEDAAPAIVLDPFAGSGTTGVVAGRLGRGFIGFDLAGGDKDLGGHTANQRVAAAAEGLGLAEYLAGQGALSW